MGFFCENSYFIKHHPLKYGVDVDARRMFTIDISDMIVTETNRYHDQQAASEPNKHKRKWDPVAKDEMKAFIGIMIHMGIVKLPRMTML